MQDETLPELSQKSRGRTQDTEAGHHLVHHALLHLPGAALITHEADMRHLGIGVSALPRFLEES